MADGLSIVVGREETQGVPSQVPGKGPFDIPFGVCDACGKIVTKVLK